MEGTEIFVGAMGIQEMYQGGERLYRRESGCCYLELETEEKETE